MIRNKIQTSISLRKEDLENVVENNGKTLLNENNSYFLLSYDGHKKFIPTKYYDHLESEQARIEKSIFLLIIINAYVNIVSCIQ